MKGAFKGWTSIAGLRGRAYVMDARKILEDVGIDINDPANLTWTANEGHTIAYAKAVSERLAAVELTGDRDLDRAAIEAELREMGEEISEHGTHGFTRRHNER